MNSNDLSSVSGPIKILVLGTLVVAGLFLLVFGASVQHCEICSAPYCMANTGSVIGCSQTQYFVSPFQAPVVSMEPFVTHWNYALNLVGIGILSLAVILSIAWRVRLEYTIQTHRLAGIAIFLWGFYLFYSSLTASYMEQPPSLIVSFYLPLVVGLVSMVFGIYLMVRRKPIFDNPSTKDSSADLLQV